MLSTSGILIANYEQGRREPDYNTIFVFADFYHVSIDYLLGRTDEKNAIYGNSNLPYEMVDTINNLSDESLKELINHAELLKIRDSVKNKK